MKNPTDDDAYHALFRSYENANKEIKELQAQLNYEQERNANNVANAQLQIDELTSEYQTWRIACNRARERADAANAEITRMREGRKIHNCEAAAAQIAALEKDEAMLDPDEAYNALFRSYEATNRELAALRKRVVELEAQLVERANSVVGRRVRIVGMKQEDKREGTILRIDNSGRNLIVHLDGDLYARLYHPSAVEYLKEEQ